MFFFAGKPCFLIVTGETCSFVFLFSCLYLATIKLISAHSQWRTRRWPFTKRVRHSSRTGADMTDMTDMSRHGILHGVVANLKRLSRHLVAHTICPTNQSSLFHPLLDDLVFCNFILGPWLSQEWLDLTANRLAPAPLPALAADDALLIIAT